MLYPFKIPHVEKPDYPVEIDRENPDAEGLVCVQLYNSVGSIVRDLTGGGNDGVLSNMDSSAWGVGQNSRQLNFDKGDGSIPVGDYLDCGDADSTNLSNTPFTVIHCHTLLSLPASADEENAMLQKGNNDSGGKRYGLSYVNAAGVQNVNFQLDDNVTKTQLLVARTETVGSRIQWAGIRDFDRDEIILNRNGIELAAITDDTGDLGDFNGRNLLINALSRPTESPSTDSFLSCTMHYMFVYNKAVDSNQLSRLYANPLSILKPRIIWLPIGAAFTVFFKSFALTTSAAVQVSRVSSYKSAAAIATNAVNSLLKTISLRRSISGVATVTDQKNVSVTKAITATAVITEQHGFASKKTLFITAASVITLVRSVVYPVVSAIVTAVVVTKTTLFIAYPGDPFAGVAKLVRYFKRMLGRDING